MPKNNKKNGDENCEAEKLHKRKRQAQDEEEKEDSEQEVSSDEDETVAAINKSKSKNKKNTASDDEGSDDDSDDGDFGAEDDEDGDSFDDDSDDDSDDDDEDNSDSEEEAGEELEVSFDVNEVFEEDFHGIQLLVRNMLDGNEFYAGELADLILKEKEISSVVKIPYDTSEENIDMDFNDTFGVISCINVNQKGVKCIDQLQKYMMDNCTDAAKKEQLQALFKSATADAGNTKSQLGLIVNERVLNMPPQLAPHLHYNLFKEINKVAKERKDVRFENFIIITKVYQEYETVNGDDDNNNSKKKRNKKARSSGPATKRLSPLYYFKVEEAHYHKEAILSFTFPIRPPASSSSSPSSSFSTSADNDNNNNGTSASASGKKKKKSKGKKSKGCSEDAAAGDDDEKFEIQLDAPHVPTVEAGVTLEDNIIQQRLVMVVNKKSIPVILDNMKNEFSGEEGSITLPNQEEDEAAAGNATTSDE